MCLRCEGEEGYGYRGDPRDSRPYRREPETRVEYNVCGACADKIAVYCADCVKTLKKPKKQPDFKTECFDCGKEYWFNKGHDCKKKAKAPAFCKKHPKYKALRKPTADCKACELAFMIMEGVRRQTKGNSK